MGTQQLLLIVLGVIVVGTAVAIGIFVFGSNADQATKDALTQGCLRIASNAQGYYMKPLLFGGGNNSFTDIEITDCGMQETAPGSGIHRNLEGEYHLENAGGTNLDIIGTSINDATKVVTVTLDMTKSTEAEKLSINYAGW